MKTKYIYKYITYKSTSTDIELHGMFVPKSIIDKGNEAVRKYIKEKDETLGEFLEHIERTDRKIIDNSIKINE